MSVLCFSCQHRYASGFTLDAEFASSGSVTALFGASGSGKSTVLSLIAGVLRPDRAKITLNDRDLTPLPPDRRGLGVIFQDQRLFPHLSVSANLQYGQRRHPGRKLDFGRVVEILEIGGLLARLPHTLSGGQRQRVALGRALLRGPELLLMDEPLAALDEGLKERILTYLERVIAEWRLPTLFVSHDSGEVLRLADHVVVLEGGRVIASGLTSTTLAPTLLASLKQPQSPANLLRVVNSKQVDGHWLGQVGSQTIYLPGPATLVQFQPRDVLLTTAATSGLSARNHLLGTVREVVPLSNRVFVAVDLGQTIWAEVTADATLELGLAVGTPVICHVKAVALQIVG